MLKVHVEVLMMHIPVGFSSRFTVMLRGGIVRLCGAMRVPRQRNEVPSYKPENDCKNDPECSGRRYQFDIRTLPSHQHGSHKHCYLATQRHAYFSYACILGL